ncbi:MAG TPA: hypothetical protein PKW56_00615 [Clostridiales bacterium]|nr:hypothetical protein [Clostridiales bacterium]
MNIKLLATVILIITAGASYCSERKVNIVFSGSNNGYYRDCG